MIRLLATSLLVALSMGVSSCGDDVTNEIIQQEPDNTLELLIGTWQGTGEAEGYLLVLLAIAMMQLKHYVMVEKLI